jgi:hypothetical protein
MLHSRERIGLLQLCDVLFNLLCVQVGIMWILFKLDPVVTVSRIFHSGGKIIEARESRGNSTLSQPGPLIGSLALPQIYEGSERPQGNFLMGKRPRGYLQTGAATTAL